MLSGKTTLPDCCSSYKCLSVVSHWCECVLLTCPVSKPTLSSLSHTCPLNLSVLSCYMFSGWGSCGCCMLAVERAAENMGREKYIWSSARRNEWKQEKELPLTQQNLVNCVNSFVNLMLSYLWNDAAFLSMNCPCVCFAISYSNSLLREGSWLVLNLGQRDPE